MPAPNRLLLYFVAAIFGWLPIQNSAAGELRETECGFVLITNCVMVGNYARNTDAVVDSSKSNKFSLRYFGVGDGCLKVVLGGNDGCTCAAPLFNGAKVLERTTVNAHINIEADVSRWRLPIISKMIRPYYFVLNPCWISEIVGEPHYGSLIGFEILAGYTERIASSVGAYRGLASRIDTGAHNDDGQHRIGQNANSGTASPDKGLLFVLYVAFLGGAILSLKGLYGGSDLMFFGGWLIGAIAVGIGTFWVILGHNPLFSAEKAAVSSKIDASTPCYGLAASQASNTFTISAISQSRSVMPAAIAGVTFKVL